MKKLLFIMICLLFSNVVLSQSEEKNSPSEKAIRSTFLPNSISHHFHINDGIKEDRNSDCMREWFEADINSVFSMNEASNFNLLLTTGLRLRFRMLNEKSSPVERASYMPRITLSYWLNDFKEGETFSFFNLMISHHSNGSPKDDIYKVDENGNTEIDIDGNFSTNYIDLNFNIINFNYNDNYGFLPKTFKIGGIYHFAQYEKLDSYYEKASLYLSFSNFKHTNNIINYNINTGWNFGKDNGFKYSDSGIIEYKLDWKEKIYFDVMISSKIPKWYKWVPELTIFLKYEYTQC